MRLFSHIPVFRPPEELLIFAAKNDEMRKSLWKGMLLSLLMFLGAAYGEASAADSLSYRVEAFGSGGRGAGSPFWLVSNRYGLVPLENGNAFLSAGAFYKGGFGKGFRWAAGLDLTALTPAYSHFIIRQLYGELHYRSLLLQIGNKEQYTALWDESLSSGDMVLSKDARPIPGIRLALPDFAVLPFTKGWLQAKGDFSIGRSFDGNYLKQADRVDSPYVRDILWHHKSLYLQIKDTKGAAPLSFLFGIQHEAQWGGTSTDPRLGKQPQGFLDFWRIVMGKGGGSTASEQDQINVLGSHYGSYDFRLSYEARQWALRAYHQHLFNDRSGMEFDNGWDGLWGLEAELPWPWLRKLVVEIVETRNQTGPFHFIQFDHKLHPGRGGGADDYYNNGEYTTGASYFNQAIGNPLLTSPIYNADTAPGFQNTRTNNWHLGLSGDICTGFTYRLLLTRMRGWGTPYAPFLNVSRNFSGLFELVCRNAKLPGWTLTASLACDRGDLFGNRLGLGLRLTKCGILPTSRKR
ncbi:MAG: capsule assembly Wzi family protein [Tannerella sp.]|jgi:hypothetical protein|nr:capsule assembly Wzi family protein [Tannerella sp.]